MLAVNLPSRNASVRLGLPGALHAKYEPAKLLFLIKNAPEILAKL